MTRTGQYVCSVCVCACDMCASMCIGGVSCVVCRTCMVHGVLCVRGVCVVRHVIEYFNLFPFLPYLLLLLSAPNPRLSLYIHSLDMMSVFGGIAQSKGGEKGQ